jgi:hypothetical protein
MTTQKRSTDNGLRRGEAVPAGGPRARGAGLPPAKGEDNRTAVLPSRRPALSDWQPVMRQFGDALRGICQSELVQSDEKAQRVIVRMIGVDMKEMNAQLDLLAMRIGELLAARHNDPSIIDRLQARWGARINLRAESRNQNLSVDAGVRPRRMLLRL